ncbi:MAG TPA: GTP-sensing pleiotropic transcriptional regulator CodY [Epulopiscium sp.]|nr:GTP-sensing pleiotropic transcriptional regulator CodY [Candidatus Epulonipiscium sp.]
MSIDLLQKMRKFNRLLQRVGSDRVVFTDICKVLSDVTASNIVVIGNNAKVLGIFNIDEEAFVSEEKYIDTMINDQLLSIMEVKENMPMSSIFTEDPLSKRYNACIIPVVAGGQRVGTLLIYKKEGNYVTDDIILGEYGATIIAVEVLRSVRTEIEDEERKTAIVKSAIGTLSYSELEAIFHIFDKLDGTEGLLIASKIADKVGITRSVIVNALRKFESAGVIESRSLGMKGTYIKVLNNVLIEELNKLR